MKSSCGPDYLYHPVPERRLRDTLKPLAYILFLCVASLGYLVYRRQYDVYCFRKDLIRDKVLIEHFDRIIRIEDEIVVDEDLINITNVSMEDREGVPTIMRAMYCRYYVNFGE